MIVLSDIYEKLYHYLAGQIDETLQIIARDLVCGNSGWKELNAVGEKLKNALLSAEERYLDAED